MLRRRCTSTGQHDAGFTTAAFAALVFGFALIAAAGVMLASQELRRARSDVRSDQEAYLLAGVAVAASARLMSVTGIHALRWSEPSAFGNLTVTVEPEALKISPSALARGDNDWLLSQLLGGPDRAAVSKGSAELQPAADGTIHRSQIRALIGSGKWRDCAATLVSPYTRLTNFNMPAPADPSTIALGADSHAGEIWRVSVDAPDGAWIDEVVRMTGSTEEPFAVIDSDSARVAGNQRVQCLPELERLSGPRP